MKLQALIVTHGQENVVWMVHKFFRVVWNSNPVIGSCRFAGKRRKKEEDGDNNDGDDTKERMHQESCSRHSSIIAIVIIATE